MLNYQDKCKLVSEAEAGIVGQAADISFSLVWNTGKYTLTVTANTFHPGTGNVPIPSTKTLTVTPIVAAALMGVFMNADEMHLLDNKQKVLIEHLYEIAEPTLQLLGNDHRMVP